MKGSFDLGEQWPWPHGSDIRQAKAGGATHMCCVLNFKDQPIYNLQCLQYFDTVGWVF